MKRRIFDAKKVNLNIGQVPLDWHTIIINKVPDSEDQYNHFILEIVIFDMTKVAASHDNKHIVAVTSNNVVRIFFKLWSKLSSEIPSQSTL